jgi:hypothetical protein
MSSTKPVGVRVPIDLLERAKKDNPNFSEFVRCVLRQKYGSVEARVDELLAKMENKK